MMPLRAYPQSTPQYELWLVRGKRLKACNVCGIGFYFTVADLEHYHFTGVGSKLLTRSPRYIGGNEVWFSAVFYGQGS